MPVDAKRRLVRKITLYSVLPVNALLGQLELGFVAEPSDKGSLQTAWETASAEYNKGDPARSLASPSDVRATANIEPELLETVLERVRRYPPYDSHPTQVCNVKLSKLVTPQIAVNAMRAETRAVVKKGMSAAELFKALTEPAGPQAPITRQAIGIVDNGGALQFTSYDEDIRLYHPPQYRSLRANELDSQSPSYENVCFAVGGGFPFAAVYRVPVKTGFSRLVAGNGIHRLYSLAAAGYEWCPIVVTDISTMEFPAQLADLPQQFLLNPASNPPLVVDFANDRFTIELMYYPVLKTVRFNWNFEQYATVLR
jgi:hypothetical protein